MRGHTLERKKLPTVRKGKTYHFSVGEVDGYISTGEYEDGSIGEIFLSVSKQGSTISGLMDTIAILTSLALQYGVSLSVLAEKLGGTRFEPYGQTNDKEIVSATSIPDYIFRRLALDYEGEEI